MSEQIVYETAMQLKNNYFGRKLNVQVKVTKEDKTPGQEQIKDASQTKIPIEIQK